MPTATTVLPASNGADGAQGPQGRRTAGSRKVPWVRRVPPGSGRPTRAARRPTITAVTNADVLAGQTVTDTADCPAGKVVLGGGYAAHDRYGWLRQHRSAFLRRPSRVHRRRHLAGLAERLVGLQRHQRHHTGRRHRRGAGHLHRLTNYATKRSGRPSGLPLPAFGGTMKTRPIITAVIALAITPLAACGGGDDETLQRRQVRGPGEERRGRRRRAAELEPRGRHQDDLPRDLHR